MKGKETNVPVVSWCYALVQIPNDVQKMENTLHSTHTATQKPQAAMVSATPRKTKCYS